MEDTVITRLHNSGFTPQSINEIMDPDFYQVIEILISKKLSFETLHVIMVFRKDYDWEAEYTGYWEMIYNTIKEKL